MRFHRLSIGQRFAFEGETWVKINTLVASCERTAHHRVIRRSAEVRPLAAGDSATGRAEGPADDAGKALAQLRSALLAIIDAVAAGGDPVAARAELEAALDRFTQALKDRG